jgi:lysyl-tRNA synthetase class 2
LPLRISVVDAFRVHAGIDLLASLSAEGEGNREALASSASSSGFDVASSDNWADIFSKILVAKVEPQLGSGRPTILFEYPRCEAALARATPHDPRVAERFELYVCGVELANGFGELTDAVEQRRRFTAEMNEKQRIYGERYPIDEDFLAALGHMPPASGVAMGFDRLVMLATGARNIDDVIWTPTA